MSKAHKFELDHATSDKTFTKIHIILTWKTTKLKLIFMRQFLTAVNYILIVIVILPDK